MNNMEIVILSVIGLTFLVTTLRYKNKYNDIKMLCKLLEDDLDYKSKLIEKNETKHLRELDAYQLTVDNLKIQLEQFINGKTENIDKPIRTRKSKK